MNQLIFQGYGASLVDGSLASSTGASANTLVKSSRIYTGQYTLPIWLLNNDNMLGEHKGREKNIVYGRLF